MKPILIILVLLHLYTVGYSQESCSDVIFPVNQGESIVNCCIIRITNGNRVQYVKESDTAIVEASAIVYSGQHVFLSRNIQDPARVPGNNLAGITAEFEYSYYQPIFRKATRQRNIGIAMTFVGVFFEIIGLAFSSTGSDDKLGWFIAGFAIRNVGIPVWISGGIKRGNNRRAMDYLRLKKLFSVGPASNGIELRVHL